MGSLPLLRFLPDLPVDLILKMPPNLLSSMTTDIIENMKTKNQNNARKQRSESFTNISSSSVYSIKMKQPEGRSDSKNRTRTGETVLFCYFFQLFDARPVFVDLSERSMHFKKDQCFWDPAPLYFQPGALFTESIRMIYSGLYHENPDQFESGLDRLNLVQMKDIFMDHFASGNVEALVFKPEVMKESFRTMLSRLDSLEADPPVELAFLALSLMCLYDALQNYGPLNARKCYELASLMASM